MPPLTSSQKAVVKNFVEITGTTDKIAQKYLREHRYRTEPAIDAYLAAAATDNGRVASVEKVYDDLLDSARGDTRDKLSTETTIEYLESLGVNLESAELFVVMELLAGPAIGEITRQGFVDGWVATNLTSFTLAQQKKHVSSLVANLATDAAYFKKVYRHAFTAGKEIQQRALLVEHAQVYWKMLFSPPGRPWVSPKHDWAALWAQFIESEWKYSVSKDMWSQVHEFSVMTMADEELNFYSNQDAWPSVLDDFVIFYRKLYPKPAAKEDDDNVAEDY